MNATLRPSGDHSGSPSASVLGSRKRNAPAAASYTPMKPWSPRLLTKASRAPLGDQTGFEHCPRVLKICEGAILPSTAAHQSWPRQVKATRSPFGETAGELPSATL